MTTLPALEYLLRHYYHQTDWSDRTSNEVLWRVFLKNQCQYDRQQLKQELEILLQSGNIGQFIKAHARAATSYPDEGQAIEWAQSLTEWCSEEEGVPGTVRG